MVILPGRVSFRFDHVLIRFSIFARVSCELKSHILETSGGNVTPKILIGLCSQSKLCSLHNVSVEFILDPIHNALVFSLLILVLTFYRICLEFVKLLLRTIQCHLEIFEYRWHTD